MSPKYLVLTKDWCSSELSLRPNFGQYIYVISRNSGYLIAEMTSKLFHIDMVTLTFLLFLSTRNVTSFLIYLTSKHKNNDKICKNFPVSIFKFFLN